MKFFSLNLQQIQLHKSWKLSLELKGFNSRCGHVMKKMTSRLYNLGLLVSVLKAVEKANVLLVKFGRLKLKGTCICVNACMFVLYMCVFFLFLNEQCDCSYHENLFGH